MVFLHTYVSGYEGPKSEELFRRAAPHLPGGGQADRGVRQHRRRRGDPAEAGAARAHLRRAVDAVQALALLRDFGRGTAPSAERPEGPADAAAVRAILARCREEGRDPLLQEALAVAAAYGVPVHRGAAGGRRGRGGGRRGRGSAIPVALKVGRARTCPTRPTWAGCRLNLRDRGRGAGRLRRDDGGGAARPRGRAIQGALVQPMAAAGRDLIVGAKLRPQLRPRGPGGHGRHLRGGAGRHRPAGGPLRAPHRRGDAARPAGCSPSWKGGGGRLRPTWPPWSR